MLSAHIFHGRFRLVYEHPHAAAGVGADTILAGCVEAGMTAQRPVIPTISGWLSRRAKDRSRHCRGIDFKCALDVPLFVEFLDASIDDLLAAVFVTPNVAIGLVIYFAVQV